MLLSEPFCSSSIFNVQVNCAVLPDFAQSRLLHKDEPPFASRQEDKTEETCLWLRANMTSHRTSNYDMISLDIAAHQHFPRILLFVFGESKTCQRQLREAINKKAHYVPSVVILRQSMTQNLTRCCFRCWSLTLLERFSLKQGRK